MPFDSLPVTSPTIETLRLGRILIERGWAQKRMQDNNGRVCLVGSITRQPAVDPWTVAPAIEYLRQALPEYLGNITAWNDNPTRSIDEIIAVYDRAIDLAVGDQLDI
jgi:hypothetical protein